MAKVTRLNVMITASTKGLSMGINKAQGMLKDLNRTARGVKRDMGKAFNGIGSMATRGFTAMGAAATAAATGLAYLTKTSIDAIGDANDFAKSLGLTYNQLRAIQFAAGQAGVDAGALNAAFAKMSDTLGTAFGGNKAAIQAFQSIGLSVEKLAKMSPAQQFEAIANAINKIQDPSKRMAAARDIFGKSGGQLISLFENAGEAINEAAATLGFFGVNLTQLDVSKIDNAGDAMGTLGLMMEGIGNQLARVISPYIQQAVEDTITWVQEMGGVGPAIDVAFGGVLDKLDQVLNKIDAIQSKWDKFIGSKQSAIAKGFEMADKASEYIGSQTVKDAVKAEETNRRLQSIPEHRREQARALLEKQGGFASESIDAGTMAEAFGASAAERASSAAEADARIAGKGSYGDSFRNWRAKADYNANIAAGGIPIAPPVKYKDHVPNGYQAKQDAMKNAIPDYKAKQDAIKNAIPDYRAKQEAMKNATPGYKAKQDEMKNSEPILQVLRNIEANTGKNKIAFAGPN